MKTISDKTAFINLESVNEMELQLKIQQAEIDNLEEYLKRKKQELLEYKQNTDTEDLTLVFKSKLEEYKALGSEYDLKGQGIIIEVRDSERMVKPGENPNDFLVHDQDLLRIINDLKISGAEAISINGQRYMGFSEIKCSGPTVTINGKTYGQPFIIKAIGDSTDLEAAIKSIDSYSYMLNNIYGIKIDVRQSGEVIIPKYMKIKKYNYLHEITEDGK
ncbi:MAG: DUF881 domain-containing protein [Proteocatella sp.]